MGRGKERSFLSVGKNLAKSGYFSLIIQSNSKNEYKYFLNYNRIEIKRK